MRIFSRLSSVLAATALLAACHAKPADPYAGDGANGSADPNGKIDCQPAGASGFSHVCDIERQTTARGLVLTVRQPSGAFRRLLVTKDGRGVVAADGAEKAQVRVVGAGAIEVAIAGDRYRLPATVKGQPKPPSHP